MGGIQLSNAFWKVVVKFSCRSYCTSKKSHPFDNVVPFESNKQLANYLCENILYDNNGIVVLNKPYGVCFSRDAPQWKVQEKVKKQNIIRHNIEETHGYTSISVEEDKVNLFKALPYIKSNLNCDTLCIIKSPEKYTTGVSILGKSEEIRTKVKKCWERSRAQKIPLESYLAICNGVPISSFINHLRIGVTIDVSKDGKSKRAILTKSYSHNMVLKSSVKVATVSSSLMSLNKDQSASLVQLNTNQKKWHFVRLFLATHLLSPAIGDHLFGSRVRKVMGTHIAVDYWSEYASQTQKLDSSLLTLLDLQPGSEKYIPTLIHLSEVRLIQFFKHSDLVITAPPPAHFNWTIDRLGLSLPTNMSNSSSVETEHEKVHTVSAN